MHGVARWMDYGNRTLRETQKKTAYSYKGKHIFLISVASYFSSTERSSLAEGLQQRRWTQAYSIDIQETAANSERDISLLIQKFGPKLPEFSFYVLRNDAVRLLRLHSVGVRWMNENGPLAEWYWQGEKKYSKKNLSQCHISFTTNTT